MKSSTMPDPSGPGLKSPYFVDYIRKQAEQLIADSVNNSGFRIYTTLDLSLQEMAEQKVREAQPMFEQAEAMMLSSPEVASHGIQAALLSTDPRSGEILAMVGGRDYTSSNFNRAVQSKKATGSSFKPIVYSYAMQKGYKWSDILYVDPITVDNLNTRSCAP